MEAYRPTHSLVVGYLVWIFGFIGSHRFYFGKPVSGTLYFFTLGIFFIGWIVDLFLIPSMEREADLRFQSGPYEYNLAWLLLVFLGLFGIHRLYLGKPWTAVLYFLSFGLFGLGYLYDMWTWNDQISLANARANRSPIYPM